MEKIREEIICRPVTFRRLGVPCGELTINSISALRMMFGDARSG
jgi:hypothetical protein